MLLFLYYYYAEIHLQLIHFNHEKNIFFLPNGGFCD
jgi:hypothetical protein